MRLTPTSSAAVPVSVNVVVAMTLRPARVMLVVGVLSAVLKVSIFLIACVGSLVPLLP